MPGSSGASGPQPLILDFFRRPLSPEEVENESFAVIDREAPAHGFSPRQWLVVKRMIHACADLELARRVRFSVGGVDDAVRALRDCAPIYLDANMARVGLSLARLRSVHPGYGPDRVFCHVADPDVAETAKREGLPRSIFAVRKAKSILHGAIAVFGNAPLALLELNRMIIQEGIIPAFVVAMPVGFVHVVESKQELVSLDVPHLAVEGRRGGSALAVSAIHGLCTVAVNEKER